MLRRALLKQPHLWLMQVPSRTLLQPPTSKAPATSMAKKGAAPADKSAVPTAAAAGGGDGKVWVNTKSKTYHCENTKYYGKTTVGEYVTEADAKEKCNHADHGKVCTK